MKDIKELDSMTLWDITANEGGLTMFVLSISLFFLSVVYPLISLYYKIKFWR